MTYACGIRSRRILYSPGCKAYGLNLDMCAASTHWRPYSSHGTRVGIEELGRKRVLGFEVLLGLVDMVVRSVVDVTLGSNWGVNKGAEGDEKCDSVDGCGGC